MDITGNVSQKARQEGLGDRTKSCSIDKFRLDQEVAHAVAVSRVPNNGDSSTINWPRSTGPATAKAACMAKGSGPAWEAIPRELGIKRVFQIKSNLPHISADLSFSLSVNSVAKSDSVLNLPCID